MSYGNVDLRSCPPVLFPPPMGSGAPRRIATPPSNQQRVAMSAHALAAPTVLEEAMPRASGALKSGSRAAPLPEGIVRGFATAGSLVKSHHFNLNPNEALPSVEPAHSRRNSLQDSKNADDAPKKPKKRATKTTAAAEPTAPKPKQPRARRSTIDKDGGTKAAGSRLAALTTSSHFSKADTTPSNIVEDENTLPAPKAKSNKARKPRTKKVKTADRQAQGTIEGTKASREEAITKPRLTKSKKTTSGVTEHFGDPEAGQNDQDTYNNRFAECLVARDAPLSPRHNERGPRAHRGSCALEEPLALNEAVSRRRDWTPVKDTEHSTTGTEFAGKENDSLLAGQPNFTTMLSGFAFATDHQHPTTATKATASAAVGVMKRRRVELNDLPANQPVSRDPSPEKIKAKKKARTITDLVTGQYAQRQPILQGVTDHLFDDHATTITTKVPLNDVAIDSDQTVPAKPARKRQPPKATEKKNAKSKKASSKATVKPKMIADKLLSPSSALSRLQRQDILFGTSSQLALEDSPTSIRQLQDALRESEAFMPSDNASSNALPGTRFMKRVYNAQGRGDLWAASARDKDGLLLEKLENVYIPEPDRTQEFPLLIDAIDDAHLYTIATVVEDIPQSQEPRHGPIQISSDLLTPPHAGVDHGKDQQDNPNMEDMTFEDIDDYRPPPPSNQHATSSFLDIDDFPPSTQPPPPVSPPSSLAPTSGVAFINVSPFKCRGRPLKSHYAISPDSASTCGTKPPAKVKNVKQVNPPGTPSKRRGRFANIEEILDSEDDEALSPTPPQTSKFADSPPLSLVPSMPPSYTPNTSHDGTDVVTPIYKIPIALLAWNVIQDSVFKKITATVKSLPLTTDPTIPSWYEKILLYDPIVLEDFTAFLNSSTRIRTWRRATQKQIKSFNKQCKAHKEQIMGVDDEGDEVLVVEKELETWMVQGWCQEMSICCINKEGRGRGGARKGHY